MLAKGAGAMPTPGNGTWRWVATAASGKKASMHAGAALYLELGHGGIELVGQRFQLLGAVPRLAGGVR